MNSRFGVSKLTVAVCALLLLSASMCSGSSVAAEDISSTIFAQQQVNWGSLKNDTWYYPPYLGEMFLSEYYIELLTFGWVEKSAFNAEYFTLRLLDLQLPDGSWEQVHDASTNAGQLDATIFNYWYLKTIANHADIPAALARAQAWVLQNGGIEQAQVMTKFKLAAYGLYSWSDLSYIPLFVFHPTGFFSSFYAKDFVAQWIYPHLTALAYLRYQKTVFQDVPVADLTELWLNFPANGIEINPTSFTPNKPDSDLLNLVNQIFAQERPMGSIGAYTISTLLSCMVFKDFSAQNPAMFTDRISSFFTKAFSFVEFNYFNDYDPYQGSLDDGRWWDSILVSWAMLESGESTDKVLPVYSKLIAEGLQPNKGIGYGFDFEYAPDTDDTGLLLVVMSYFPEYQDKVQTTINWLLTMQNPDGGYPAFDTGKTGGIGILAWIAKITGISGSAEIFDPSCPDITGHVLEGLAKFGYDASNNQVQSMISYLKDTQSQYGSWEARWGLNYVYSAGAVIPGLARVNYDLTQSWVQACITFLVNRQNADGGFGESFLSYTEPQQWNGKGVSTVSQTAWGLLALIEVYQQGGAAQAAADKAAAFLLSEFASNGNTFYDVSTVGTGHRGLLYLQYPSYAQSFPLIALARYQRIQQGTYNYSQNLYQ